MQWSYCVEKKFDNCKLIIIINFFFCCLVSWASWIYNLSIYQQQQYDDDDDDNNNKSVFERDLFLKKNKRKFEEKKATVRLIEIDSYFNPK